MRVNLIEYNNPTFFLDFINDNEINSYQDINNLLDTYQETTENVKKELHGLIMARPSDIFTYSDEEGTILDQLNEKEEQLLENLAYYTHILEDVTLLKNYIDDYVIQNISDEKFEEFKNYNGHKYKTKEDLVFDMVVHKDRYDVCKKFQNLNDPLVPGEKSLNNIIEHALFNVNKNNYNVCPNIQGKKENTNEKYIIYIRDKKNNFVPYINKKNNLMFDAYKEAEEEAQRAIEVSYIDYMGFDYRTKNKQLFDINNDESFFKELMMNYNNINVKDKYNLINNIIYNILVKYYKLDYSKDRALEIINDKSFSITRKIFGCSSESKQYENLILPIKEYIISSSKKVLEATQEEYQEMFNKYLMSELHENNNRHLDSELYLNTMTFTEICNKAIDVIKMEYISEFNMFHTFMRCEFENKMSGSKGVYKIKKITY